MPLPLPDGPIELELDSTAKGAVSSIIHYFNGKIEPEEAIERALGTEVFLLRQIKEGGQVFIEKKGERLAIDLMK
jgi:hypothetical protein